MSFVRITKGASHTYSVLITSPGAIHEIQQLIDRSFWSVQKIGFSILAEAKTIETKALAQPDFRVRGSSLKPLEKDQKDLLSAAGYLSADAEWSGVLSILDILAENGYTTVSAEPEKGIFLLQKRPRLPPR